ncbi:MAG TPA: GntR family transcriptional regulator, partial [Bacilli bacterium]
MQNDRVPLYLQIQEYFKEQISSKNLLENDRIPTEKEIMEQFNVSRITVVNALSGLAQEGWIYRIPGRGSFVKEGKYEPKQSLLTELPDRYTPTTALEANTPNKRTIGLVMTTIGDYFAIRLLRGITQALNDSDFQLIIMLTFNSQEREQYAIKELARMGVEGLLIFPSDGEVYNEEILALKIKGFPFALIDRYLPGIETNIVCSDGSLGAQLAVSHLWELGHRDIVLCADVPVPTMTVEERISGYMKELKARGGMINPANILTNLEVDTKTVLTDHPLFRFMESSMATAYIAL